MGADNLEARPPGVTIAGGVLTFIGGFSSFVLILGLLEELQRGGWAAIAITGPASLLGFLLYGLLPLLVYSTGVALLSLRPWSYKCVVFVLPVYGFFFCLHQVVGQIQRQLFWPEARVVDLIAARPEVFWRVMLQYLLLAGPFLIYFCRSTVYHRFFPKEIPS